MNQNSSIKIYVNLREYNFMWKIHALNNHIKISKRKIGWIHLHFSCKFPLYAINPLPFQQRTTHRCVVKLPAHSKNHLPNWLTVENATPPLNPPAPWKVGENFVFPLVKPAQRQSGCKLCQRTKNVPCGKVFRPSPS